MPRQDNIVNADRREDFWGEYNRRLSTLRYKTCQAYWYLRYRLSRWKSVSGGMFAVQVGYWASIIGLIAVPVAISFFGGASDSDEAATSSAGVSTSLAVAGYVLQSCFAAWIGLYKSRSSGHLRFARDEAKRRKAVSSLMGNLEQAVDSSSVKDRDLSLQYLCRCVAWDAQEFFQIAEEEVACVLLSHDPADSAMEGGSLIAVGRDKPADAHNWSGAGKKRPALASYAYEAIRIGRSVTYHDVSAAWFQRFFPDPGPREYRSVLCLPISREGASHAHAVMAINITWPFVFMTHGNTMDQRASAYVQMANLFMPQGGASDDS